LTLPDLLTLEDHDGDWPTFFQAVYAAFCMDFVDSQPTFRGQRLALKRHPEHEGKSATFWHMISEGSVEADRTPDLRRCERIRWPRPAIEGSNEVEVRCWESSRQGERRVTLWVVDEDYVVVLARRNGYVLPWTAYLITYNHTRTKLEREFQAAQKAGGAPL